LENFTRIALLAEVKNAAFQEKLVKMQQDFLKIMNEKLVRNY